MSVRDSAGSPEDRLRAVLEAYAELSREHDAEELAALLHRAFLAACA
jgi:TorA maturation chaperone TorD